MAWREGGEEGGRTLVALLAMTHRGEWARGKAGRGETLTDSRASEQATFTRAMECEGRKEQGRPSLFRGEHHR